MAVRVLVRRPQTPSLDAVLALFPRERCSRWLESQGPKSSL